MFPVIQIHVYIIEIVGWIVFSRNLKSFSREHRPLPALLPKKEAPRSTRECKDAQKAARHEKLRKLASVEKRQLILQRYQQVSQAFAIFQEVLG